MKPRRAHDEDIDADSMGHRKLLNHRHGKHGHHKAVSSHDGHHDCDLIEDFAQWAADSLKGEKFSGRQGKYKYIINSGGEVDQVDTRDNNKVYALGSFTEYGELQENFDNGEGGCPGGAIRSGSVHYTFGPGASKFKGATEGPVCQYILEVQLSEELCPTTTTTTTLACDVAPLDEYEGMVYHVSQESTLYGDETYTYSIAVGSEIEQQTGPTNNNKKYNLGTHKSYDGETEEFGDGDKCGSTPRTATVSYTFVNKPELLRASEVSTCKYEFEIQLPHAVSAFTGRTYSIDQTSTLHGSGSRYTYTVEVGGDIIQKTNNAGTYTIGTHTSFSGEKEYFGNGDSCGGGKKRSATVTYSYGSEAAMISADEPETCVYEFKIQLPEQDCR
jgi:hypothetical protein